MYHDPIVDEVQRVREELLGRFKYDLKALAKHTAREAAKLGLTPVSRPPRKPALSKPVRKPDKKSDAA